MTRAILAAAAIALLVSAWFVKDQTLTLVLAMAAGALLARAAA